MSFETFLKEYGIYISIGLFVIILAIIFFYAVYPRLRGKKEEEAPPQVDASSFYLALGGKDNVKSLTKNGSRLSVELVDMSLYNKDKLKELGVTRTIVMINKLVLLVDETFKEIVR